MQPATWYPGTRYVHWLSAGLFLALLPVGFYMKAYEAWSFYEWHKSFGVLALVVTLLRLFFRKTQARPALIANSPSEKYLASAGHYLILALCVLMPLSGMCVSAFSGHGFGFFGLPLFPANYSAANSGEVVPLSADLYALSQLLHRIFGFALAALIVLHVGAALKHHFLHKDATLVRMLRG